MADIYKVITPENIELDYQIAGIGSRFLAIIIDVIIQGIFMAGLIVLMGILKIDSLHSNITDWATSLLGTTVIFLSFMIWIGYYIILEAVFNGQTIGKMVIHLRVRKELGYAPNFWDILLRNLIRPVDFLPFGYTVGFIAMFLNRKAKRLGDYAAGTIVVKEWPRKKMEAFINQKTDTRSVFQKIEADEPIYSWLTSVLPFINQTEYLLLKDLWLRRSELTNFHFLALTTLRKILQKALCSNNPALTEQDAAAILDELIKLYEQTYFN